MPDRPKYHQSSLSEFEFCGWGWYLKNIEKAPTLSNYWLCRGTGVHKARETNLRQKVESAIDLDVESLIDAARDEINRVVTEDGIDRSTGPIKGLPPKVASGVIVDSARRMIHRDINFQRKIQPLEVEVKLDVHLPQWPFDLGMTLDSIDVVDRSDVKLYISDLKTTKAKWSYETARKKYQPKVYRLGLRAHRPGEPFGGFRYQIVSCTPKKQLIRTSEFILNPSEAEIGAVLERFQAMHNSINAGLFTPCHASNWKCSPEWCELYRECRYAL